ncbi:MAG: cytochrome c biogenesis protein ResB [Bacteroidetes bacterium]|nr:cytochrome c biogenesis protein ResB [Bacteroidota bacterium]
MLLLIKPTLKRRKNYLKCSLDYKGSFLVATILLIGGFILETILHEYRITLPKWPINLYIILGLIICLFVSGRFLKSKVITWLSSVPAAVSAISVVAILVLMMGFIPQQRQEGFLQLFGLTHIKNSWPYLFSTFYLLMVLGFTIVKRLNSFNLKNIAFLLNHLGLWILLVAASLGSADMKTYNLYLMLDRAIYHAKDANGVMQQMPFAVKLLDFDIDEYPPSLGIVSNDNFKLNIKKGDKLFEVNSKETYVNGDWQINIIQYIAEAKFKNNIYETSTTMGATPAAEIKATNTITGVEIKGWVSSSNFLYPVKTLLLDEKYSVAMTIPQPKKFSSKIRIFKKVSDYYDAEIAVNEPINVYGFKMYQVGYDEEKGKWSKMSSVQLIRDPWLPVVYIGIFMILLGSLYLLWMGKAKN